MYYFFSSHDKWCFGVGVRHIFSHSLDLESPGRPLYHWVFIFRYFRLGYQILLVYSAYFGWHKHILNLHTSIYTRYITLGKVFDIITRSRSSRQPSNYLLYLLDFSLRSTFETFERAHSTRNTPIIDWKKKEWRGKHGSRLAWINTPHIVHHIILFPLSKSIFFFSFIPRRRGEDEKRNEKKKERLKNRDWSLWRFFSLLFCCGWITHTYISIVYLFFTVVLPTFFLQTKDRSDFCGWGNIGAFIFLLLYSLETGVFIWCRPGSYILRIYSTPLTQFVKKQWKHNISIFLSCSIIFSYIYSTHFLCSHWVIMQLK